MDLVSGFCLRRTFEMDREPAELLGRYVGLRRPRRDNAPTRALESRTARFWYSSKAEGKYRTDARSITGSRRCSDAFSAKEFFLCLLQDQADLVARASFRFCYLTTPGLAYAPQ